MLCYLLYYYELLALNNADIYKPYILIFSAIHINIFQILYNLTFYFPLNEGLLKGEFSENIGGLRVLLLFALLISNL